MVHIAHTGKRIIPDISGVNVIKERVTSHESRATNNEPQIEVACCADAVSTGNEIKSNKSEVDRIKSKFTEFLGAASSPHGLDAYTKQAMAIALSVAMRCEPCLKYAPEKSKRKRIYTGRNKRSRLDGNQLRRKSSDGLL